MIMINKIYNIILPLLNSEKLNINFLNDSEPSYSIEPISDVTIKKYIEKSEIKEFTFDLWYMAPYGDDIAVNKDALGKLSEIADFLEKYEDDEYSFFAADVVIAPRLSSVSLGLAKYKVRIAVTYSKEDI